MTYTDSNYADEPAETFNPFPGLRPFETDEYTLFFGREGQSDELLARLARTRFLAVVGTSGSGKSSLIRAGLLPALYGGLMAGAGSAWRVALFRPGGDPVGNLAAALCSEEALGAGAGDAEVQAAIVEATLRRSTLGVVDVVRQARLKPYENLLVVVDQFEELFRFRASREAQGSEDDAAAFVKLLLEAPQQKAREELAARRKHDPDYQPPPGQEVVPVYVVLTMRSDFLGDCSQFQGLPEAINDGQYLIPRMTRDERRAAITGPAAVGGGEISLPLVNRLLNDVGDNPDQLPIMQHALMRTWENWAARCQNGDAGGASCSAVELSDYEAVGTMTDALSRHADEAYNELPDERSRLVAEKMFKALTEKGADSRETRRPATLGELCEIAEATPEEVSAVVETFRREGRSFLMPPAGTPLTNETVIDISHESLIRNWVRLKKWVDEEAQSARIYRRIADAATLHGAGQESLATGAGLQVALDWREKARPNAAWASHYHPAFAEAMSFLDQSKAAHEAAVADRERQREEQLARERRELEQAQALAEQQALSLEQAQRFAAEQQHAAQRMRRMIFVLALASLVALGAAGGAAYAYADARASRVRAEGEKERAEAESTRARLAEQSAVEQKRLVEEERNRAKEAEAKAEAEQERALKEEAHAREEEAHAREQEGIARRNAEEARRNAEEARRSAAEAARSAEDARRQAALAEEQKQLALDKTKQVEAAVQRGEMIRSGLEAFRREDFAKALNEFKKLQTALKDFQPGGPSSHNVADEQLTQFVRDYGWTLTHLGDIHFKRDELSEAVASYEAALPILGRVIKPDEVAPILFETYHGLGHAYQAVARRASITADSADPDKPKVYFAKAEEFFNRAATYQKKHHADEPLQAAAGYMNLARLYADMERPDAVVENYKLAAEAYRKAESRSARDGTLGALKELAEFYSDHGSYEDVARVYNEMVDVREDAEYASNELLNLREPSPRSYLFKYQGSELPDIYSELGQVYRSLKQEARADAAFMAADKIQQISTQLQRGRYNVMLHRRTPSHVADELEQLGDTYLKLDRFKSAEQVYLSAAYLMEQDKEKISDRWKVYEKLAALSQEHLKDSAKAEAYYKLRAEAQRGPEYAEAQRLLADLYANKLNNPAEAEVALMRVYRALEQRDAWEEVDEISSGLIELHRRQNNETGLENSHARRFNAMTGQHETFRSRRFERSPELPKFFAAYAKALGEIADFYLSRKDNTRAEEVFRTLHATTPEIIGNVRDPAPLGVLASSLEKYRTLLLDARHTEGAARIEELVRAARARQKELEKPRP